MVYILQGGRILWLWVAKWSPDNCILGTQNHDIDNHDIPPLNEERKVLHSYNEACSLHYTPNIPGATKLPL